METGVEPGQWVQRARRNPDRHICSAIGRRNPPFNRLDSYLIEPFATCRRHGVEAGERPRLTRQPGLPQADLSPPSPSDAIGVVGREIMRGNGARPTAILDNMKYIVRINCCFRRCRIAAKLERVSALRQSLDYDIIAGSFRGSQIGTWCDTLIVGPRPGTSGACGEKVCSDQVRLQMIKRLSVEGREKSAGAFGKVRY